jgi:hypothetical protein
MTGLSYSLIVLCVGLPHLFSVSSSHSDGPAGGLSQAGVSVGGRGPTGTINVIPMQVKVTRDQVQDYAVDADDSELAPSICKGFDPESSVDGYKRSLVAERPLEWA